MLQQPSFLELANCSHVKRGPMKRVAQRLLSQEPGKRIALKTRSTVLRIVVPVSTIDTSYQLLGLRPCQIYSTRNSTHRQRLETDCLICCCCAVCPAIGDSDSFLLRGQITSPQLTCLSFRYFRIYFCILSAVARVLQGRSI